MSNDQTPLPKPTVMLPAFVDGVGEYEEPMFDSMSMREYGRARERAAYERAAKECEEFEDELQTHGRDREADVAWRLARRIEALGADK